MTTQTLLAELNSVQAQPVLDLITGTPTGEVELVVIIDMPGASELIPDFDMAGMVYSLMQYHADSLELSHSLDRSVVRFGLVRASVLLAVAASFGFPSRIWCVVEPRRHSWSGLKHLATVGQLLRKQLCSGTRNLAQRHTVPHAITKGDPHATRASNEITRASQGLRRNGSNNSKAGTYNGPGLVTGGSRSSVRSIS